MTTFEHRRHRRVYPARALVFVVWITGHANRYRDFMSCAVRDCGNPQCRTCYWGRQNETPVACTLKHGCLLVAGHRVACRTKDKKEK